MTINDDKLRRADKALSNRADTSSRESWQELLSRPTPVATGKALQAARAIAGLTGSWTAFYDNGTGRRTLNQAEGAHPVQAKVLKLGQAGMPEINFVPYSVGTNRFGAKGPSLLGHPISFSVVGPTLKTPSLEIQWLVTDNSAVPGTGDVLTIDSGRNVFTGAAAPLTTTIEETYGFANLTGFPGGLYLVVLQTGYRGDTVGGVVGGLGDGFIFEDAGPNLREPIQALTVNSKYEIFRVVDMGASSLTLDPGKRLADHFTIPAGGPPFPALRAIMLLEPHVARMAALPGSGAGVGMERSFVVLPPERTANSDLMPAYDGGTLGDGTWRQGGFDELNPGVGYPAPVAGTYYGEQVLTPIRKPLAYKKGQAAGETLLGATLLSAGGYTLLLVDKALASTADAGRVIHIYRTQVEGTSTLFAQPGGTLDDRAFLGWFEVVSVSNSSGLYAGLYYIRRLPEVDPNTGKVTHALNEALTLDDTGSAVTATGTITVGAAPATGQTITITFTGIGAVTLLAAGGARTGGLNDYNDTLGTINGLSAEITAAINDAANNFDTFVTATDLTGSVRLDFIAPGEVGNRLLITESSGGAVFTVPASLTGGDQDKIRVEFTTHAAVSSIHAASVFDLDNVEAARLTNIIDPSWVERSAKETIRGGTAARADRAIFDTASSGAGAAGTNADPGSLLDLGFRMVLYPATGDAATVIPDWDHPITSNNVVLVPGVNEAQSLVVDYASGMVHLSHSPVPGAGCDIAPNGILGTSGSNPRGEIVLFAACVPYSMEEGQTGTGPRIKAQDREGQEQDMYGARNLFPVSALVDGVAQVVTDGASLSFALALDITTDTLPATGFVDVVSGVNPYGDAFKGGNPGHPNLKTTRATTFGYGRKSYQTDTVTGVDYILLEGVYGGGDGATPGLVQQAGGASAVLRRDIVTPQEDDGTTGSAYPFDTTYGFSARSENLTFEGATLSTTPGEGTKVVFPRTNEHSLLFDDLFSSWLLNGGQVTALGGSDQAGISETVVLIRGVRTIIPYTVYTFGYVGATEYLYVRSNDPNYPRFEVSATLPLPRKDDILLAKVSIAGVITDVEDLRHPLTEMDKRLDITVGEFVGTPVIGEPSPHFDTLGDAITYVGAIMDPTAGNSGNYLRIKIVGTTEESKSVPIVLPCNGVIVEGAGQPQTQIAGGAHGIVVHGQGVGIPCIDMNGKEGWVWRNLQFVKDVQVVLGPGADPVRRTLFSGACKRFLFDGCNFDGADNAHGFIHAASTFEDVTIRNCEVKGVLDFGVHVADTATMRNLLIDHCIFTATTGAASETTLTDQAGVRLPNSNAVPGPTVRDSMFQEFLFGIVSGSRDCTLKGNRIVSTIQTGIVLDPHISTLNETLIEGNTLSNVWTDVAPGTGISLGNTLSRVTIRDNTIALSGVPAAGARDISGTNVDHVRVVHNECLYGDIKLDSFNFIEVVGNTLVTGGLYLEGDDCLVEGNQVLGTQTVNAALAGGDTTSCLISTANRLRVANNHFLDGLDLGFSNKVVDATSVSNNTVGTAGAPANLRFRAAQNVNVNNNQVSGGIVDQLTAPDVGAVGPIILTGNFADYIRLAASATGSIVSGNHCVTTLSVFAQTVVLGNVAASLITSSASTGGTYIGNIISGTATIEHTQYTVMGNKANTIANLSNPGVDPDAVTGVAVGNTQSAAATIVPKTGPAQDNNV